MNDVEKCAEAIYFVQLACDEISASQMVDRAGGRKAWSTLFSTATVHKL
jgi:hypothetical protein